MKRLAQAAAIRGGGRLVAAAGFAAVAGCASPECPRWHEGGTTLGGATLAQASVEQWAEASAENQLAAAAYLATSAFDIDDEYAWLAVASLIQGCINEAVYAESTAEAARRRNLDALASFCAVSALSAELRGVRSKADEGATR